jgi:hypothetical protein
MVLIPCWRNAAKHLVTIKATCRILREDNIEIPVNELSSALSTSATLGGSLLCLVFQYSSLSEQCRPQQDQIGGVLKDSGPELIMNISMFPREFSANRLVCLATTLRESYRNRNSIIVSIFNSPQAASHSLGLVTDLEDTKEAMEAFAHLHARYLFSADRNEDYVETIPMHDPYSRKETKQYNTRINLSNGSHTAVSPSDQ